MSVPAQVVILAFNASNQLAVRAAGTRLGLAFVGADEAMATARLESCFKEHTPAAEYFTCTAGALSYRVFFTQVAGEPSDNEVRFHCLEQLDRQKAAQAGSLAAVLAGLEPHLIEIPYLHLGENDYIYKFRVERDRNRGIYQQDDAARALYQSQLCEAIKRLSRTHERTAGKPAMLDFGAVRYVIPSHFGFCLGVKNAIERAYETLAENPGRRVFMLSELIHNPFVNEDLLQRGLRYLQSDKGVGFTDEGLVAAPGATPRLLWDTLTGEDVVIIPAFGATDEDKKRLVRKGLKVAQYDATCMLVEKVWKAARSYGRAGYTVIIHGKSEHEETKATFSNSRRHAPSLIIRHLDEARLLGDYISAPDEAKRAAILEHFAGLCTPGFDPAHHLERIAVVNQTTLLMNETAAIIDYFKEIYTARYGAEVAEERVGGAGRKDTLCYATQVNQDALQRALGLPLDAAFIIGGKNSSNTYQLYRLCEQTLGKRAFFIQSEKSILGADRIMHYVFPSAGRGSAGHTEMLPLWPDCSAPKTVLITGGASCPDGLVQQVVSRINALFPAERLRKIEDVLAGLRNEP
ncbi:4-hydroxy-3-methylbut-2-enyl diphosphate reductase [Oleiharenicola lentus]|jgi:4-hydroxy-3-methylbut-2-enyl diphosphate reductase|uniref:4-hydroxy-3-methylbut-2-enyl diphosphate reductase n=1 Tax=Oleiharenicola lentus TaxID=2508720 RepID=A0A4Q1CC76_9BACT|nr:4-hydroxy-3-methylbut-2-enyl diphosphate reductase [Oleiharenicola lentus]RXK56727.1 4-hydroxy-3-methylbut-2-enyl diphosphate reductase [Oleiharenicola lentus]